MIEKIYPYWCETYTGKAYYEYGAWMSKSVCQIEDTVDMVTGDLTDGVVKSVLAHNNPDERCRLGTKVKVLVVDQYHESDNSKCEHEKAVYLHSVNEGYKRFTIFNTGSGTPYIVTYTVKNDSPNVIIIKRASAKALALFDDGSFEDIRDFFIEHPALGISSSILRDPVGADYDNDNQ